MSNASNIVSISITEAGRAHGERLPYRHLHGEIGEVVRREWGNVDGFVLFCATGIAVRLVGPLLGSKASDPAVICVDESGTWAVALIGGHRGANDLAHDVAALLGATAVVTTATDNTNVVALDTLPGFTASGDLAGVSRAMLDGVAVRIENPIQWPVPVGLSTRPTCDDTDMVVVVSDQDEPERDGVVTLTPRSLVIGVGSSAGAPAAEIHSLFFKALTEASLNIHAIGALATVDLKAQEPGIVALAQRLSLPLLTFSVDALKLVDVPNPSEAVAAAVGTPSVAEASALLAAGPGATLVVPKQRSAMATIAIARRRGPVGSLRVVGLGPGDASHRTPAATTAVRSADVVIGYSPYVDLCADLLVPRHDVRRRAIGAEEDRCREALATAADGSIVALVCSGDAGVYAMASLVFELAPEYGWPPIEVVPGVTAALAAAAVLGAPLGHDHASISLSDLLTPWPVIHGRIKAAAEGDFVVTFYNPRSLRRTHQLGEALAILAEHRPPTTPVAAVTDVGRPTQNVVRATLATFDPAVVDMLTCVVVGSSTSRWSESRFVTPRGYRS